jgi:hypothetical protein
LRMPFSFMRRCALRMRRERVTIAEQTPKRTRVAVKLGEMRGIYCVREEMNGLRNVYTAIDVVGYCVRY